MISTTIKKEYMEAILKGEKKIEYRAFSVHWKKRLGGFNEMIKEHKTIKFLCGRNVYEFKIKDIIFNWTPKSVIDIVKTGMCYHIHLGERIGE